MFERVKGYIDKSVDLAAEIARIKRDYALERVYRFDLGENAEGYSPRVEQYLDGLREDGRIKPERLIGWLSAYPDRHHLALRRAIGAKYGIPPQWVIIDGGADSLLNLITRVFLDQRDAYLMPVPSFFLFEEYSERMGAVPYFLELKEKDEFRWTDTTTLNFKRMVDKFRPKLVWLANPNNPTGHLLEPSLIEELIDYASGYNAFVVVDEAYGEYTDPPGGVNSAARLLERYDNLMVLRTFSKKYGLASLRIGYLMCASADVREGLQVHRQPFPTSQAAADLALIALEDHAYLEQSRARTLDQRREVFARLAALPNFALIPSQSSIFMLRHRRADGDAFAKALERRGILASQLNISGIRQRGYLRFTLRSTEDNLHLCNACAEIDRELA